MAINSQIFRGTSLPCVSPCGSCMSPLSCVNQVTVQWFTGNVGKAFKPVTYCGTPPALVWHFCAYAYGSVVVGVTMQAIGMGTSLLTRISVGQRKATGVYMELRKTSDSPRSEENKKTTGRKSNNDLA